MEDLPLPPSLRFLLWRRNGEGVFKKLSAALVLTTVLWVLEDFLLRFFFLVLWLLHLLPVSFDRDRSCSCSCCRYGAGVFFGPSFWTWKLSLSPLFWVNRFCFFRGGGLHGLHSLSGTTE